MDAIGLTLVSSEFAYTLGKFFSCESFIQNFPLTKKIYICERKKLGKKRMALNTLESVQCHAKITTSFRKIQHADRFRFGKILINESHQNLINPEITYNFTVRAA